MGRLARAARFGRRLGASDAGATALETALVAPMFIALAIATVQVGVLELVASNFDAAVMSTARKIRTGAVDRPKNSAEFANLICSNMIDSLADCRRRLSTSVQRVADFSAGQQVADAAPTGQFNAGGPEEVILVRATYRVPLVLPLYAGNFQMAGPTEALLDARTAFRNEPYQ